MAKVEHHTFVVEFTDQLDIDDPAFADHAALRVKVTEIDDGEIVNKQAIPGEGSLRR
jgi:hypothetical protein